MFEASVLVVAVAALLVPLISVSIVHSLPLRLLFASSDLQFLYFPLTLAFLFANIVYKQAQMIAQQSQLVQLPTK